MLIQYPLDENSWSNWIICTIEDGKIILDGKVFDSTYVRVLKEKNPKNPQVSWYIMHENILYEVNKSNNQYIQKATPVDNKSLKTIKIPQNFANIFTIETFNDMLNSAKDYLAPPVLSSEDIDELMQRTADVAQVMNLMAGENHQQRVQNWWKDLYEQYRSDVESQLQNIVQQPFTQKQQIEALKSFLAEHYQFIQGTCLDYVAIPGHPVTRTLSEIARRLATDKISAIEILMPGISIINAEEDTKNLSMIPLNEVLESHIALRPGILMPVKSLIKFIDTENPVDRLYSPYYSETHLGLHEATQADIQALFEHSEITQHLRDAYLSYEGLRMQDDSLLGQLNILGKNLKLYDNHGGIGQAQSAASGAYPAILNFMKYYLNLESCALNIINTPPKVEDLPQDCRIGYAFYDNQLYFLEQNNQRISLITEADHLAKFGIYLGRFEKLGDVPDNIQMPIIIKTNDDLYTFFPGMHTIDARVIRGNFPEEYSRVIYLSESNIPKSIYDAIIKTGFEAPSFAELFKNKFPVSKILSEEDLAYINIHSNHSFMAGYSNIPLQLRNEIELLWQLFHNPAKNIEATQNFETCIGIRGGNIRSLSRQYEEDLSKISVEPQVKLKLLRDARSHLNSGIHLFHATKLEGHDSHLGLSMAILERYQKIPSIQSFGDLYHLEAFNPRDLAFLVEANEGVRKALTSQFNQLTNEDFITYFSETSIQILEILMPYSLNITRIKKIFDYPDAMFEILGPEKSRLLKQQLTKVIKTKKDFLEINRYLDEKTRPLFIELLKENWPQIITSVNDFNDIIFRLFRQGKSQLIETFKEHFSKIIHNTADLRLILRYISFENRPKFFESLKERWSEIITTVGDYKEVVSGLPDNERAQFFSVLKKHWPQILKRKEDIPYLFHNLSLSEQNQIFGELNGHWEKIFPNFLTFSQFISYFTSEQRIQLFEELSCNWQQLALNFLQWIKLLAPYEVTKKLEAFKDLLPMIIQDENDFEVIMKLANSNQKEEFFKFFIPYLPKIIKDRQGFYKVKETLTFNQNEQLIGLLISYCPNIIPSLMKSGSDLSDIMLHIPSRAQKTQVFELLTGLWSDFIKTGNDFQKATSMLLSEQRLQVMNELRNKWPEIIKDSYGFNFVMTNLDNEQRMQIIVLFKEHFPGIIINFNDLYEVLNSLKKSDEQERQIIESLSKDFWTQHIIETDDLFWIIHYLSKRSHPKVIDALIERLDSIIHNAENFDDFITLLDTGQRPRVIEALFCHLPKMIINVSDFTRITKHLSPEQRAQFVELFKDSWVNLALKTPCLFHSPESINQSLINLIPEHRINIIASLNEYWLDIIADEITDGSLQHTIQQLKNKPRVEDILGFIAELKACIQRFSDGVLSLSHLCKKEAIEGFLTAILSQNSQIIYSKLEELFKSYKQPIHQSIFQNLDSEKEILRIIREKFPHFCNKHIQSTLLDAPEFNSNEGAAREKI
jgi:hypothetical protein